MTIFAWLGWLPNKMFRTLSICCPQSSLRTADVSPRSSPLRDVLRFRELSLSGEERGETSAVRRLPTKPSSQKGNDENAGLLSRNNFLMSFSHKSLWFTIMGWQASHIELPILQMFRSKPQRRNFGIQASVRPLVVEGWQETFATIWHIICRIFNWGTEIRHNVCPSNNNASTSFKGPVSEQTLKVVLRCTPDPRKCFRSHNPLNSYAGVYRSRSASASSSAS